ncbi:MAG: metallophosphoesterase [Patescibacteria group bacterium]
MPAFDLRKSHEHPHVFDAFLILLGVVGLFTAWSSFRAGGFWDVLGILALVGEALLAYGVFIEPQHLSVVRYREPLVAQPTTWVSIAFLSDLHAGGFRTRAWFERVARETAALHPDLILLGGDFVADRVDPLDDLSPLTQLSAPLGKFFVLGNHDFFDRPQEVRAAIRSFGFTDLTNTSLAFERNGRAFELSGIDDVWYGNPKRQGRSSPILPHVTLSHEPDILLDLAEKETDLVLSGHTHGGQVRLPFVGPLWPVPTLLGRNASQGRFVRNGITGIISNGLGETDGRLRLMTPPQIVLVEVGI